MVPIWAKPEAKVVCISSSMLPGSSYFTPNWVPHVGNIYTIDRLVSCRGLCAFILKEQGEDPARWGYLASRFRPLITEADDIALFKSLLNPTLVDKLDLLAERLDHIYNE